MRNLFLLLMIVMMSVMSAGCSHTETDTAGRMEKAEVLLSEKYGETFVVTEYLGENLRYKTFNVEAYATAYPDLKFDAIVDFDGDGMRDFYVARRVSAKATESIEKALSDIDIKHFIHTEAREKETTLTDPDSEVEEFIENNKKKELMVYLYVDESEADLDRVYECLEKTVETLDCASGYIQVFLTDQDMMEEVEEYVDSQREFYGSYKDTTTEDLIGSFRFEKGVLTGSKEDLAEKIK